jgi:hypothetical protein
MRVPIKFWLLWWLMSLAAEHPHPSDEITRSCRQKEEHMIFPMFKHLPPSVSSNRSCL